METLNLQGAGPTFLIWVNFLRADPPDDMMISVLETPMTAKSSIALLVIVCAASASMAKDANVPTVDLKTFCKDTAAITVGSSPQSDLDVCVNDQLAARDQLVKDWATYPQLARGLCVKPNEYRSAYIEWLTCIEMTTAVLKMRKENAAAQASEKNSAPAARQCPVVKVGVDGQILSVNAC
jgi:hypothetical protein